MHAHVHTHTHARTCARTHTHTHTHTHSLFLIQLSVDGHLGCFHVLVNYMCWSACLDLVFLFYSRYPGIEFPNEILMKFSMKFIHTNEPNTLRLKTLCFNKPVTMQQVQMITNGALLFTGHNYIALDTDSLPRERPKASKMKEF